MDEFDRKKYDLDRYYGRKYYLMAMLGGKCVSCCAKDNLEFDHIDPKSKSFTLCKHMTKPMSELISEAKKCQLLCKTCHNRKTHHKRIVPHGGGKRGKHGCKCIPCRNKNNEYMRLYKLYR